MLNTNINNFSELVAYEIEPFIQDRKSAFCSKSLNVDIELD